MPNCLRNRSSTRSAIEAISSGGPQLWAPPKSLSKDSWWATQLQSLHQDLTGRILGGPFSFNRSTRISQKEFLVDPSASIAPPESLKKDSWWTLRLQSLHQDFTARILGGLLSSNRPTRISQDISCDYGLFCPLRGLPYALAATKRAICRSACAPGPFGRRQIK